MATDEETAQKHQIAIRVDASGATVYMTRDAIGQLVEKLKVMSAADPKDCFEVHLGMHFALFDSNDVYTMPRVSHGDGLARILSDILAEGAPPEADASPSPFEVTLMHVPQAAVDEETARADS